MINAILAISILIIIAYLFSFSDIKKGPPPSCYNKGKQSDDDCDTCEYNDDCNFKK